MFPVERSLGAAAWAVEAGCGSPEGLPGLARGGLEAKTVLEAPPRPGHGAGRLRRHMRPLQGRALVY